MVFFCLLQPNQGLRGLYNSLEAVNDKNYGIRDSHCAVLPVHQQEVPGHEG
jgi:hypothetical protein